MTSSGGIMYYSKAIIGLLQPTVVSVTTNFEQHDLLNKGMFPVGYHPPASLEPGDVRIFLLLVEKVFITPMR